MYILSRKNSENQQVSLDVHNYVQFASDLLRTSSSFHIFSHLFTFHLRWGTLEIAFTTLALQCSSAGSNGPSFDSNFSWRGQRHVRHVWGSSTDLLDWEDRVQQMTSFAFSMIFFSFYMYAYSIVQECTVWFSTSEDLGPWSTFIEALLQSTAYLLLKSVKVFGVLSLRVSWISPGFFRNCR